MATAGAGAPGAGTRPVQTLLRAVAGADRALYLSENGYDVQVGEFCDTHLTPRNPMLLAQQPAKPTNPDTSRTRRG